jgi:hypothetical protein
MIKELPRQQPAGSNDEESLVVDRAVLVVQNEGDRTAEGESSSEPQAKRQRQNREQPDVLGRNPVEVTFFRLLQSELQKSIRFFDRAQEEFSIRVSRLHEGSDIMQRPGFILVQDRWSVLARSAFKVYKDLLLLETYAIMTYCSFSKILKKHDKVTGRSTKNAFMSSMVNGANFSDTTRLQQMIQSCEERYNAASEQLVRGGRSNLQEDERLFLNMVSQLNSEVLIDPDSEGAPVAEGRVARALESAGKQKEIAGKQKDQQQRTEGE